MFGFYVKNKLLQVEEYKTWRGLMHWVADCHLSVFIY